jgi:hypothetical protein
MKKKLLLFLLLVAFYGTAQQITLKKGTIIDAIPVNDSISESFALYLPNSFDISKSWPIVFVFDEQGRGRQALSMFRQAAEEQGYILAASNNIQDSVTLSTNILVTSRMFKKVYSLLPIKKDRSYTAGFSSGARLASIVPIFIKEIKGVISCGSAVANEEVLSPKNTFHFIGIVGNEDYNYLSMKNSHKILNKLKFPNQLLIFDGGHNWPESKYLSKAMEIFTLAAMNRDIELKDEDLVNQSYQRELNEVNAFVDSGRPLRAHAQIFDMLSIYKDVVKIDTLKNRAKALRKTKLYKLFDRNQNSAIFKENFIKDEYAYFLEEDVLAYNYNNLGWWKYQMEELEKYEMADKAIHEKQMGRRLKGYVNALIADNIDIVNEAKPLDEEALLFLWMVSTITDSKEVSSFLKIISLSAKVEDYGTSLFYLEELLKTGYSNKEVLYGLENTALLRITPEFNALVVKYLKDARYETIEE